MSDTLHRQPSVRTAEDQAKYEQKQLELARKFISHRSYFLWCLSLSHKKIARFFGRIYIFAIIFVTLGNMIDYLLDELQPNVFTRKKDALDCFDTYFF